MEHLRDGIGLRGYGQKDPKNEYKKEGYNLFLNMMAKVSGTVLAKFFEVQVQKREDDRSPRSHRRRRAPRRCSTTRSREHPDERRRPRGRSRRAAAPPPPDAPAPAPPGHRRARRSAATIPCPCGSGKKFKKCHGAALEEDDEGGGDDGEDQPRA